MIKDTRCPNCKLINLPSATNCLKCNTPLSGSLKESAELPPTVDYSQTPPPKHHREQIHISHQQPASFGSQPFSAIPQNNPTGRRTYFWYRVYCSLLAIIYIALLVFGFLGVLASFNEVGQEATDVLTGGLVFLIAGLVFGLMYLIGVILPAKPYSWIYGIVLIGLGMTSCLFIPLMVPLIIFWMKPETQVFFERK